MLVTLAAALAILAAPALDTTTWLRRRHAIDEERFCAAVHTELRAGASLRDAVAAAGAEQSGTDLDLLVRIARSGAGIGEVATAMRVLPRCGRLAGAALRVAATSGGKAGDVFLRLADHAGAEADLHRQRRVLTAQARLSALIVAGLPVGWLLFGGMGKLRVLIDGGGAPAVALGVGMELLGVALVWRIASS